MAKSRSIRVSIINSAKVARLTWEQEAWWHRLLLIADDWGSMELDSEELKVRALGRRAGEVPGEAWQGFLKRIKELGLIRVYETDPPDGKLYANIVNYEQTMKYGRRAEVPMCPMLTESELRAAERGKKNPSFKAFMAAVAESAAGVEITEKRRKKIREYFDSMRTGDSWAEKWKEVAKEVARTMGEV